MPSELWCGPTSLFSPTHTGGLFYRRKNKGRTQELYWRKSLASAAKAEQKVARLMSTGTLSVQLSLITQGSILPSYICSAPSTRGQQELTQSQSTIEALKRRYGCYLSFPACCLAL